MSFKVLNYESYYRLLIGSSVHLWYDRKVRFPTLPTVRQADTFRNRGEQQKSPPILMYIGSFQSA
jgi:hypothetical protein